MSVYKTPGLRGVAGVVSVNKGERMKKIYSLMFVALLLMIATAGCNAFRGAGEDISDAGKHMQNVGN